MFAPNAYRLSSPPTTPESFGLPARKTTSSTSPEFDDDSHYSESLQSSRTRQSSLPSTAPSQPVSIPPRARPVRGSQRLNVRRQEDRRASRSPVETHKPDGVPPSVAALLALTSIPAPKKSDAFRRHRGEYERMLRASPAVSQLEPVSKARNNTAASLPPRSVMDVLLSPPDELEEDEFGDDSERGAGLSSRSISCDSVPSLYTDDEYMSSPAMPRTPTGISARKASYERKSKSPSSLASEDCATDHPLLPTTRNPDSLSPPTTSDRTQPSSSPPPETRPPLTRKTSVLKSNLTASFRALRSAARSFSNFAASTATATPFITPEDYLTRSILSVSPQLTDERRPLPLSEDPTPALRRYLNPTTTASPLDKANGMQQYTPTHPQAGDDPPCTASIQLQVYRRVPSRRSSRSLNSTSAASSSSSSPGPSLEVGTTPSSAPAEAAPWPTRRENRENSDFLRVIVCEMNMRRAGKLAEEAIGKARFVLPPRSPAWATPGGETYGAVGVGDPEKDRRIGDGDEEEDLASVPKRWRAVSPGY
ncbi:MAG: hypothetical protein M1837_004865 [Sclerophora amabilis]|nr:MAG: hypothetical protein M1837_004865 [Sclerophora amabilis]